MDPGQEELDICTSVKTQGPESYMEIGARCCRDFWLVRQQGQERIYSGQQLQEGTQVSLQAPRRCTGHPVACPRKGSSQGFACSLARWRSWGPCHGLSAPLCYVGTRVPQPLGPWKRVWHRPLYKRADFWEASSDFPPLPGSPTASIHAEQGEAHGKDGRGAVFLTAGGSPQPCPTARALSVGRGHGHCRRLQLGGLQSGRGTLPSRPLARRTHPDCSA